VNLGIISMQNEGGHKEFNERLAYSFNSYEHDCVRLFRAHIVHIS